MATEDFFEEQSERSEIKTEIVRKYFWAWAKVISKQVRKFGRSEIGYVDLFAGPGRYTDGSKSTPILILEGAIRDADISQMLITIFNDEDSENCKKLRTEIEKLSLVETLKHKPLVRNLPVNDELAAVFESEGTIPSLFFLDPWGYKGLSLRLVNSVIQSWGCDCMFFFNYNRINAALSNPVMTQNMNAFFGVFRAETLRADLRGKLPDERETLIITSLKGALTAIGGRYSIEYLFKDTSGAKTSHFLIFVSKNVLGYNIMKSIMAKESSSKVEGVASFGFNPKDAQDREIAKSAPFLFEMFDSPIRELAQQLLAQFRGQTLSVVEIYRSHHLGTTYILKNYQDALRQLEQVHKILVSPPADERRKIAGLVTFGESVIVKFPDSGE